MRCSRSGVQPEEIILTSEHHRLFTMKQTPPPLHADILSQLLGASRRVPPAVAVAEVIRDQSPPRFPRRRREVPPDEDLPVPHTEPPAARRGGRRSDCSPSRGTYHFVFIVDILSKGCLTKGLTFN
ncbi:unnamed protein product [Pleuronectes platessa]|uniref:Uncharacterized protein n=1 Tax=Pleuronectes platessa TaxID=8262 RepID=A0A9N7UK68_PLEPL|nr:unnamed protein product [Pleuronectes platessa]